MLKLTKLFSAVFALLIVASMSSCGDGVAATKNGGVDISNSIPADATGVLIINTGQLMKKADYDALKKTDFFQDLIKETQKENPEIVPFLNDPESLGISMKGNMGLYFTLNKEVMEAGAPPEMALILPISDVAKIDAGIEASNKEKGDDALKFEEKDGYSIAITKDSKGWLVKNDKYLLYTTFDDAEKIKNILTPSGDGIKANASYNKHLKENKDFMFWMGADPIVESVLTDARKSRQVIGALGMAQIPEEALKGNYMSFYYDFKDGEVDGGASFDFSEPLKEELGDLLPSKLAVDYSKYIPAENMAAAVSFGINNGGVLEFLSTRGFDKEVDKNLAIFGLNLGQIGDGLSGDMAAGLYPPATEGADPQLVFALGLKDKAFMEGLIDKFGGFAGITKEGDNYVMSGGQPMDPTEEPMKMHANIQGDVMIVSNSTAMLEKALAGGSNKNVAELQDGWMGVFLDYAVFEKNHDAFAGLFPTSPSDLALSKMMMEYNEITTSKFLMKGEHADLKVGLKTTNINSLKRMIEIANEMYKDKEKIQAEIEKNMEDEFGGFDEEFGEENT